MNILSWFKGDNKFVFAVLKDLIKDPFNIIIGFYFATQMLKGLLNK